MKIVSKTPEQTEDIAVKILRRLTALPPKNSATVLTLKGDLGSGKTTFSQFLAKRLGVKEGVTSPTFLLIKRYPTFNHIFQNFFHIDAYRVEKESEISNLNFSETLADPENIISIEWPEKIPNLIPNDAYEISFEHGENEFERIINVPDELS
ncbi:MAG: tRNA (adenosine(37)-N6)-threonylcarbamoyltransferase complex ATPase subunit type 1 TsaE [Candidatus Paceibacterota bacterium]